MKLGITLIIIGVTDIALSMVLGVLNPFAIFRLIIDVVLIIIGSRRIYRTRAEKA